LYLESSRLLGLAAPLSSGGVELSYVLYQPGAYYLRHVDQSSGGSRVISFIVYLGDPTTTTTDDDNENNESAGMDSRPWDCVTDGGALRVYGSAVAACTANTVMCSRDEDGNGDDYGYYADITPTAGTLVIFDSATVKHEVMTTYRQRAAVVGWFRE
jgi:hypothetical protein